ncbi:MAG: Gfo/Idh/MocA family oxidoreductase [Bradyrhizobium sp.]|uniref:Gfo/Idh/MocA family protein n=1 Tax=Bradyrhizobium sp. TaxID=376 RepID=UPI0012131ACC|nr:Gfo/Idh/MocA family oxidoreductase [Bradyrhizobium sp.]THD63996.1 MAG: Gfo/Idh/MocA family oxidoreductase [Bradyrhizobium sp.]
MIRIGIVGCNYGRLVHLPAFRLDPRCEVIALAGTDSARTAELAHAANIPLSFGSWIDLVEHPDVDAVTIATPPALQHAIALRALELGKPVFAEKPMAADLQRAAAMLRAAEGSGRAAMVDFNFSAILAWRKAKLLLEQGALGRLRHVAVNWNVENQTTRMRIGNWRAHGGDGGGVLGNFVSHSFHYIEWLCGPISGLSARLSGLPDAPATETNAGVNMALCSGASASLAVSCASYLGSGHRLEFYGEDGSLTLANETSDYMRGFELRLAQRPATAFAKVEIGDSVDRAFPQDGRIAPVSRLAADFLDAISQGRAGWPGFAEGYRVQTLLDTARRAHKGGCWLDVEPESGDKRA